MAKYGKKRQRNQIIIGTFILLLLIIFGLTYYFQQQKQAADPGYGLIHDVTTDQDSILKGEEEQDKYGGPPLTFMVLDVDDALSVLIDVGSTEILYDAGYAEHGNYVVDEISEYVDGELDYLIVSHSHADHCGGVPAVLNKYTVNTIITSGEKNGSSEQFDNAMRSINNEGCTVVADENLTFDLGNGAVLNIIEALDPKDTSEPNDLSVCALVEYQDEGFLITGDNEEAGEKALKGKIKDKEILALVAGHHMSRTSSNATLLQEWNPEYIFASTSGPEMSEYGFPHKEAIARCLDVTSNVYATYQCGDIILTLDGGDASLNVDSELALSSDNLYKTIKDLLKRKN